MAATHAMAAEEERIMVSAPFRGVRQSLDADR
jgi:hypothetical protein